MDMDTREKVTKRLGDTGKWERIKFDDIRKGHIIKLYNRVPDDYVDRLGKLMKQCEEIGYPYHAEIFIAQSDIIGQGINAYVKGKSISFLSYIAIVAWRMLKSKLQKQEAA